MFNKIKRPICALLTSSMFFSSLILPMQNAHALAGEYHPQYRNQCSIVECAFKVSVPLENWEEIALLHNPQGLKGRVDGRSLYNSERWMAIGQETAGILGLNSADVVLKYWQGQLESHPWIVARFLPERGELRINVLKTIKTPDGYQRVLSADYTPEHGKYDIIQRHFLPKNALRSHYARGINPWQNFAGDRTDPTFYHMTSGAAQVAMGRAMAHFRAPYGFFIETSLRLDTKQSTSGNFLRKKITTTTTGYARPIIYMASPLSMTASRNNVTPSQMAVICPLNRPCTDPAEVAFSGFVLERLEGGNIPDIEEVIYKNMENKSSWTGVAFMLVTAALTWGVGAMVAGSGNWVVANGAIQAAGTSPAVAAAAEIAGTTVSAASGMGYATINGLIQGGPIDSIQQNWLGQMGLNPEDVTNGTTDGSYCNTTHCQALYDKASERHIQSGNPGTPESTNNFQGTRQLLEGNCPLTLTAAQCIEQGLDPGKTQRTDSHTNRAYTTEDFERKRQPCVDAGYGGSQASLYRCMASYLYLEDTSGEQP